MKNYWLIVGGISIGYGIAQFGKNNASATFQTLGGLGLILVGIYGFKNK